MKVIHTEFFPTIIFQMRFFDNLKEVKSTKQIEQSETRS